MYRHGINAVRIPVGWWIAFDPNPPAPFIGGCLEALDNAFTWAQAYSIKCIIDLHAALGSQNGMEHSASRDGSTGWPTSPDYISKTLDVIEFLASRSTELPPLNSSIACKIFLLGLIGCTSQILGYTGINYSSPTLASAISNLVPAFTFILALIFRMEKLALRSSRSQAKIIGTVVSLSGAFLVTLYKGTPIVLNPSPAEYAKHPALLGIELLNEPSAANVPLDILLSYYKQGYQIVRKYSSTAYVIVCQRIGNADPLELFQANIGSLNIVVDLHYYNLFDPFFVNLNTTDNIQFIFKSRQTQLQALNSANGPLIFIGEWVNEWNVTSGSQRDYQDFGRAQLEVYNEASFGWAYWTLKNDRKHWDFEWNIRNNYLQLGDSPAVKISNGRTLLGLACS
ncbi:unnamed protein product [Camellia sinensis]